MNNVVFIKKSILMLILVLVGSASGIQAQSAVIGPSYTAADSLLWGLWAMESSKQVTYINSEVARTRDFKKSDLMKRDASVQNNLFFSINFFDDDAVATLTDKGSSTNISMALKGKFVIVNNHLIITINKDPQITYETVYSISGDKLSISFQMQDEANTAISYQYNMVLKKEY